MQKEITATELSKLIDLSIQRVGQLAKSGIITKQANGRYANSAITQYVKYLKTTSDKNNTEFGKLIDEEKHRQLKRENDIAEGLVAPIEIIEEGFAEIAAQIAPALERIPLLIKRNWPEVTGDQIMIIKKAIAECRNVAANVQLKSGRK